MLRYLVLCLLTTLPATAALAAELIGAQAITVAGEQRMLSQRIVKCYAQIGLNIWPDEARVQMDEASRRFDENLESLADLSRLEERVAAERDRLQQLWQEMKAATGAPESLAGAEALAKKSDEVLAAAERLTRAVEQTTGLREAAMVNRSARQRMLSQRLAKAFMLRVWGVRRPGLRDELSSTVTEFSRSHAELAAYQDNSPEISLQLNEIAVQWEWLKMAMATEGASSYRLIVAEAADEILTMAERLARLYEDGYAR